MPLLGETGDGGAGNDTLNNSVGNDLLLGGDGDDTLIAVFASTLMYGGADDDSLVAGGSNVTLDGGSGDDTLVGDPHDRRAAAAHPGPAAPQSARPFRQRHQLVAGAFPMTATHFRKSVSAALLLSASALAGCAIRGERPPAISYDAPLVAALETPAPAACAWMPAAGSAWISI